MFKKKENFFITEKTTHNKALILWHYLKDSLKSFYQLNQKYVHHPSLNDEQLPGHRSHGPTPASLI